MNVASLNNCKELFELSGWDDTVWFHFKGRLYTSQEILGQTVSPGREPVSAYDLGYLLRKLPWRYKGNRLNLYRVNVNRWTSAYNSLEQYGIYADADTPEDAACKLCVELFKQGVLTKERNHGE